MVNLEMPLLLQINDISIAFRLSSIVELNINLKG